MILARGDPDLLKQLKAAGDRGRNVREMKTRVGLDRLVKGGYLVGRPADVERSTIGSHSAAKTPS
jgi:hypothetical protein